MRFRTSGVWKLAGVLLLAALLWPADAQAQINMPDRRAPDLELRDPPELEITGHRVYDNDRDGTIEVDETMTLLIAVVNNGQLRGSFDYAVGPENMRSRWWGEAGADLDEGDRDLVRFDISWQQLLNRVGYRTSGGVRNVCLGLYLVRRGTTTDWTDADNPNHRKKACFKFSQPAG